VKPNALETVDDRIEALAGQIEDLRGESAAHYEALRHLLISGSTAKLDAQEASRSHDELYLHAEASVIAAGKASTSHLQRKLGIGYSRAAQLMDALEERGIIGPADGSKPRKVLAREEHAARSAGPGLPEAEH
jgi:S-DNA-T family DNA segregation ATPase FtsK/SpoIIIE